MLINIDENRFILLSALTLIAGGSMFLPMIYFQLSSLTKCVAVTDITNMEWVRAQQPDGGGKQPSPFQEVDGCR